MSRLVQSPCEPPAQSSATTADLKSSNKPELVKTTIKVKLTSGRIVWIVFEDSLPLKTDSTGALVTDALNISTSQSSIGTKHDFSPKRGNVYQPDGISRALFVNPSLDLANAQQHDPHLSQLIAMKKRGVTKPSQVDIEAPIPKIFYSHYYHTLFLHDGLLVKSIGNRSPYPNYVIVTPIALREAI